ncbi:MAG TPA: DNA repair protein RecN [Geobacterales bacterium]|nr:DNA repair protein RecN [Geobacterales bacterium]
MLTDLNIKNFAIIDELHIAFRPGLTILTGETGAGKSIIIDAVGLILGGRASADLVRSGEEEAMVEAVFDLSDRPELLKRLAEMGVESTGELLVRRIVSRSGKNRVFMNGTLSISTILAERAREMINIYGQHDAQSLMRPENHLTLLDSFGALTPLRSQFSTLYHDYRRAEDDLRKLSEQEREAAQRLDLLSFQTTEINDANLRPGEEESLQQERQLLVHAEKLFQQSQGGYDLLYGGDGALLGVISSLRSKLGDVAIIDPALVPLVEGLTAAHAQLEDVSLGLRDYAARIDVDPARLQEVEDRLDLIQRLKKKYGSTIEEILAQRQEMASELDRLLNSERTRSELEGKLSELQAKMVAKGEELSRRRRQAAATFKLGMEKELHSLAMRDAVLEVFFEELSEPRMGGYERAEFYFSPNPGETPKPLARIASGGELSRLMLAFKQVHPESDVPTLIFDEVDSGIGGATSALGGKKLKKVAARQQVLCITHLPQVAAFADHHCRVEKRVAGGRTTTALTELDAEGRVLEMARMLGSEKITDMTMAHAREMIAEARKG